MMKDGAAVALVMVKGKWNLPDRNLIVLYETSSSVRVTVDQMNDYLRISGKKYGIITTYEYTWFVKRSQDCPSCPSDAPLHEVLYVSPGISFDQTDPTLLQCFAYFASITDNSTLIPPPTTPPQSRLNSQQSSEDSDEPHTATGDDEDQGGKRPEIRQDSVGQNSLKRAREPSVTDLDEEPLDEEPPEEDSSDEELPNEMRFGYNDFKKQRILGFSRCNVVEVEYKHQHYALKIGDLSRDPELLGELRHEVRVYEALRDLQGERIPRVCFYGDYEFNHFVVGFSLCGSVPKRLTQEQKDFLVETLNMVHDRGFLHGDIRKENILVDESGRAYLIDFGFAEKLVTEKERQRELEYLEVCLTELT